MSFFTPYGNGDSKPIYPLTMFIKTHLEQYKK